MRISIVDYGVGNVASIINALKKVGIDPILTRDKQTILESDGLILPGVGAFSHGMDSLYKYGLIDVIYNYVEMKKPFMGICLGMQMLMDESEEFGITKGLGLIKGRVIKLSMSSINNVKLPHISWNEIDTQDIKWDGTILDSIPKKADMYFVHSYVVIPDDKKHILSTTEYSNHIFCSSIKKDNIYGCQFHPEKSGKLGLEVMKNFVNLCKENTHE